MSPEEMAAIMAESDDELAQALAEMPEDTELNAILAEMPDDGLAEALAEMDDDEPPL